MSDLKSLSETELQALIGNAEKALKNKQLSKRKEVIAQIKELAASIDMTADVHENKPDRKKSTKVAIKYRNPNNPSNTWTGRGVMPIWLRDLLNTGRDRSEFEV